MFNPDMIETNQLTYLKFNPNKKIRELFNSTMDKSLNNKRSIEIDLEGTIYTYPEYKPEEVFFTIEENKISRSRVTIDNVEVNISKDGNGKLITEGDPLHVLIKIANEFSEGKNTFYLESTRTFMDSVILNNEILNPLNNIPKYFKQNKEEIKEFKDKGIHFCTGYLSQFENKYDKSGLSIIRTAFAKLNLIIDYRTYQSANKAIEELVQKNQYNSTK